MKPTILIDANNASYRSLVVIGNRQASGHTGSAEDNNWEREVSDAVTFGLLNLILRLGVRFGTNKFVFAWDCPKQRLFRRKIYPDYKKEKRYEAMTHKVNPKTGRDFIDIKDKQFDYLRTKLLPYIGFNNQLYQDGLESDDLVAQLVLTKADQEFIVVSNDKDMFQLLDYCKLYRYEKRLYDKDVLREKYNLEPIEFLHMRALSGDNSDCIEGIPNIGKNSATDYINGVLVKGKRFATIKAEESQEIYRRNLDLMELPWPGAPVPELIEDDLSFDKFLNVVNKIGLSSFLEGSKLENWRRFFDGFNTAPVPNMPVRRRRRAYEE